MKKTILITFLSFLLLSLFGCFSEEEISYEMGRRYYQEESLGQPLKVATPYALWLAIMSEYPEEMGANWHEASRKFGLIEKDIGQGNLPVGFSLETNKLLNTEFIMTNCALCHTGEINGQVISGLGARKLQINGMNNTLMTIVKDQNFNVETMLPAAKKVAKENDLRWSLRTSQAVKVAIKYMKELADRSFSIDAGPGRNTPIEFAKLRTGISVEPPYGFVRFPPIWTYKRRQTFGWDGSMSGDLKLAGASVEFNKGMTSDYIMDHQGRWQSIALYTDKISVPVYTGKVDPLLSKAGMAIYEENCQRCHGNTEREGGAYTEKIIALKKVKTDGDRLKALSKDFCLARNKTDFGKKVPLTVQSGYVAVPLDGIWSRAPYLHNGSVPTLEDMLRPEKQRPIYFYLGDDSSYDLQRIGVPYKAITTANGDRAGEREKNEQYKFDTSLQGNSNKGHSYGTDLNNAEKTALLEYLKSL